MKSKYLIILSFLLISCHSIKDIKKNNITNRFYKTPECFTNDQLKTLYAQAKKCKKCKWYLIQEEIVEHDDCVGLYYLYSYECKGKCGIFIPFLKTSKSIFVNPYIAGRATPHSNDAINSIINSFKVECGNNFVPSDLDKLCKLFKRGATFAPHRRVYYM